MKKATLKSSQILLSSDLTDDEILKEIHGFKKNHNKTDILLYDENMNTFIDICGLLAQFMV